MATQTARQRGAITASAAVLALGAVGLIAFRSPSAAVAETGPVVALWEMNEGAGATTMSDTSGNGIDGTIGIDVDTGSGYHEFPAVPVPASEPVNPERIVQVADNDNLEPEQRDLFVVEFRYRTTRSFGNVLQKGQNSGPGGYWKYELPQGEITCLFQGPPKLVGTPDQYWPRKAVSTPNEDDPATIDVDENIVYDDGQWHTVRCELDRDNPTYPFGILRLYVDDMSTPIKVNPLTEDLGDINNTAPLTIGGKANCNQVTITCDYFEGDVDHVRIERTGTTSTTGTTTTTSTSTSTTTTTTSTTSTTVATGSTTTTTVASGGPGAGPVIDGPATVDADSSVVRGPAAPLP